jgi:hypothetical protein
MSGIKNHFKSAFFPFFHYEIIIPRSLFSWINFMFSFSFLSTIHNAACSQSFKKGSEFRHSSFLKGKDREEKACGIRLLDISHCSIVMLTINGQWKEDHWG